MSAARTIRQFLRDEVAPWLRSGAKKPYGRQAREMAELWRAYRYLPYQYLKTGLYSRHAEAEVRDYLPPRLIYAYLRSVNAAADVRLTKDKVAFRRALAEHGLPVVTELFQVDTAGRILDGDLCPIDSPAVRVLLEAHGDDVFVKPTDGTWGRGAFILRRGAAADFPEGRRNIIVQPVLRQHPDLAALYRHAINTVRIDTLRTEAGIISNAAVLRVGIGGAVVDNGVAGGLVTGIDLDTGRVRPTARQKPKFSHELYHNHPDTGVAFAAITVPHWEEIRDLIVRAAEVLPLGSVGWDIAVTPDGPVLIEGNDRWDVTVMQLGWGGLARTELGRRACRHTGLPEAAPVPAEVGRSMPHARERG